MAAYVELLAARFSSPDFQVEVMPHKFFRKIIEGTTTNPATKKAYLSEVRER